MGSSRTDAVDSGIGQIVWVRRRNGSWWPGKILEPDELSECNLTSPRTGTPVKLLGREDASVDWYNLEKSKRVKAFRCGEFDDCIERAESAQGIPIKKREKYARREDAILHALELEKQLLKKQGKLDAISGLPRSKSPGAKKHLGTSSDGLGNNIGKPGNSQSNQLSKRLQVSIKEGIVDSSVDSLKATDESQLLFENDRSEAPPRMRGLQDLGLSTAPLKKRKFSSAFDSDGPRAAMEDNQTQPPSSNVQSTEQTNNDANGMEQLGAVSQAKTSQDFCLPAELNDPLNDEELPSRQNKMPSSQFEDDDCHLHHVTLNEENSSSGSTEDAESDSSGSDSDSSETEADMDEAGHPDAASHTGAEQDTLEQPEAPAECGSTSDGHNEALSGDLPNLYPDDLFVANEAVSKWQLKGKRNIRHLTTRLADRTNGKGSNQTFLGTYHGIRPSTFGHQSYRVADAEMEGKYMRNQMVGKGGYLYASKFTSVGQNSASHNMIACDMTWEEQPSFKGHWDGFNPVSGGCHHSGGKTRSMLIDVDLKVQVSYQKEPVPIVSLMSKLNGKAIIGHPIQVQPLEDGSSETLISTNDYCGNEAVDHVPPWKTARRTNFRVPRPRLSSVLAGDTDLENPRLHQQRRLPFKSGVGSFSQKGSLVPKRLLHSPRPRDRKFPRKLPNEVNSSFNRKTRTLSSIAVRHNFGSETIHVSGGSQMGRLIKHETSEPTTVACIPVKLVFSRLLEKINRPPSKAVSKVESNKDAEEQL